MNKTLIPENFSISSEMRSWASKKVPFVNIEEQHEQFCDYWRAHGKKMMDWVATWRNWMRNSPRFSPSVNQYSRMPRPSAAPPRQGREITPPMQPRDHPLFRKQ